MKLRISLTLVTLLWAAPAGAWVCGSESGPGPSTTDCAYEANRWPALPLPDLKVIDATDRNKNGVYDGADIDLALVECAPGCNLHLLPVTYSEVMITIDNSPAFPDGFALVGEGIEKSILQGHVRTDPGNGVGLASDYVPVIHVTTGATIDQVYQDFKMDGLKLQQNPGTSCHDDTSMGYAVGMVFDGWTGGTNTSPLPDANFLIRRVHATGFLQYGFNTRDWGGITIQDSLWEDIGCYPGSVPCSPAWELCPTGAGGGTSPRIADGFGIGTGYNSRDIIVERNKVRWVTKMCIESIGGVGGADGCTDTAVPMRNIFRDNECGPTVDSGIVFNGACDSVMERNYIHDTVTPGYTNEAFGFGISVPRCGRCIIRDNTTENTRYIGINVSGNHSAPVDTSTIKVVGNTIIDPCQAHTDACSGIKATGQNGVPYPIGLIANNTVILKDPKVNTLGMYLANIKNTDIYGNNVGATGFGIQGFDIQNVKVFGNSFTLPAGSAGQACFQVEDETASGWTAVPSNVTFYADNGCFGSWGTRSRNEFATTVLDSCGQAPAAANVCVTSGGACPLDNDALCSIIDCHTSRTPSAAVCTTPVTTTTTTTLPLTSDVYNPPEPTFPIGDEHILWNSGRIEHTTKTECMYLEARDGECLSANGCTPGTMSSALSAYKTMDFDGTSADKFASWSFETPKNMVGMDAQVQFIWMSDNGACNNAATTDVCWTIDGGSSGDMDPWVSIPNGGIAKSVSDRCVNTGDVLQTPPITFIHGMLPAQRANVLVSRDFDGSSCPGAAVTEDDYGQVARLLAVRVCFEVNNVFSGE